MLSSLVGPTGENELQPVVDGGTETLFGDHLPLVNVTQILSRIEAGDSNATEQLLPLVYDELRKLATAKLAREKCGVTWQPTVLVHEAYVRLVKSDQPQQWNGRGHFFAAAAEAMRRILIEHARQKKSQKRGGRLEREELVEVAVDDDHSDCLDLLALDEALTELEARWPEKAAVVKLRYFAGLTTKQTAQALGVSRATAERHWTFARTWLYAQLQGRG